MGLSLTEAERRAEGEAGWEEEQVLAPSWTCGSEIFMLPREMTRLLFKCLRERNKSGSVDGV